ncbi:MAG: hypothetical protein HY706_10230 [Candidatus Hydrogenedentes bacterium]|nr:hypothetical protein [Candidatus Hydrogenedentota bacterium]
MHIRAVTRSKPAPAFNVEMILDIILQFINVLEAIDRALGNLFNIDLGGIFGKNQSGT